MKTFTTNPELRIAALNAAVAHSQGSGHATDVRYSAYFFLQFLEGGKDDTIIKDFESENIAKNATPASSSNELGDVLDEQVKLHAEIMGMTREEYSADVVARMKARNEEIRAQLRERASREAGAIQDA